MSISNMMITPAVVAVTWLVTVGGVELVSDMVPVVGRAEAGSIKRSGDTVIARDVVIRKFKDCDPVPGTFHGWAKGGVWAETGFEFLNDHSPDSSRPVGLQSLGDMQWTDVSDGASQVALIVYHNCGDKIVDTRIVLSVDPIKNN